MANQQATARERGQTSIFASTQSVVMQAAHMAVVEQPANRAMSKPLGALLMLLRVIGLLAFVGGITLFVVIGLCNGLILLSENGAFPAFLADQSRALLPTMWKFVFYAMLGSTIYGFATFLSYKLEASKVIGNWMSWVLFFVVPIALILLKQFQVQVAGWMGLEALPQAVLVAAKYYSFLWYVIIFLIATYNFRSDVNENSGRALTRSSLLAILCYIPYGYVLFLGEQEVFGPILQNYVGDAQLIIWTLLPIRR